jgi:hypothetical protein
MKIYLPSSNWGYREPLTSKECATLYRHIVRVWLGAYADSPIDLSLRADNLTILRELQELLRKPGLILKLRYRDSNDGNVEKKLTEEEYASIFALESFINKLQNNYGPIEDGMFDITTISRSQFMNFVWTEFDIANPIVYDEEKAIASRDQRLEYLQLRMERIAELRLHGLEKEKEIQSLTSRQHTPIPTKVIDEPSHDNSHLSWGEIEWNNYPPRSEDRDDLGIITCHSYIQYTLSQPQIRLRQSLKTIYGDVGTDLLVNIAATIGFGETMQCPASTNYDRNLLWDLEELLDILDDYSNDEERVMTLVHMVSEYFHKQGTIIIPEKSGEVLRRLVLSTLDCVSSTRDMGNNIALEIAIKHASSQHQVTLPNVNDPNNSDAEGGHGVAMDNRKSNGNGEIANNEESYDHPSDNKGDNKHDQCAPYRLIEKRDIDTWVRPGAQLYSSSNNSSSHRGKIRDEWGAIALRALLTDKVSKYVKNIISPYAIKDWQWLARLVERLTHRGLLCYGIIVVVMAGLTMHATHIDDTIVEPILEMVMTHTAQCVRNTPLTPIAECVTGIRNDATRNICSFSWNGLADSYHIHNHIPSNWGRYSVTYTTHSEHHLPTNFAISDIHGLKQTIYSKPDLFLLEPDTLMLRNNTSGTNQHTYSSVATHTSSQTHIHQPTFSPTNREYDSVSLDTNSEVTKAVGDMMRVWGVVYRLVVYYAMEKVYDTTIGSSFAWRQIYNLIIMYFHMRRLDTHTTLSDTEVPLLEYKYDDTVSFDLQSYERTSVWHLKEYIRSSNIVGSNAESNHAHAITHHVPPTLIRLEDWGVMDRGVDERIIVVVSSDDAALIDDGSHYIIGITQHVHNHHYKSIHRSD